MIELLMVMFAYLGGVDVRIVDGPVIAIESDGRRHETSAKVAACIDGHAHIEGTAEALSSVENLAHEVLHLVDCRDDGAYNGSLLPYPPETDDPAHEFVYWAMRNPDTAAVRIERMGQ